MGAQQDGGHYEVHYRASVFKPPNFNWSKKDKAQTDFKGLQVNIVNGNEVYIAGTRIVKDDAGEQIESKKMNHILIKLA